MMDMYFTDLNTVHKPALNLHIVCLCTVLLICKIFLSEKEFQILFIYCTEFCVPIKKVGPIIPLVFTAHRTPTSWWFNKIR
jgi:hypothetical protein